MSSSSKVEWTDATWQPVTGCSKGCDYCFARRFATRLKAQGHPRYANGFAPTFHPEALAEPLKWRKPRRCFVCSMADLWDPAITNEQIAAVFGIAAACPQHVMQFLTKQAARMRQWFEWVDYEARTNAPSERDSQWWRVLVCLRTAQFAGTNVQVDGLRAQGWPLRNVWLGTTVENRTALHRVDDLRQCPAALRFISFEPLQEQIGDIDLTGIDWVIIGADSTRGAPEMPKAWVRDIRDQCIAKSVPVFYKARVENGKRVSLPKLDGCQWIQFPEVQRP